MVLDGQTEGKVERVGAVVEGSLPDVEPTRSDGPEAGAQDVGPQVGRRRILRRSARQAPPAKRRRRKGFGILRGLGRLWIPLVILAVLAGGGFAVSKLRSVFGSEQHVAYSDTRTEAAKPIDPKYMRYEIFGAPGTVATISYFGSEGSPEKLVGVSLPWSVEFPISTAASVGSIAAQGDSGSIGCRIIVDGEVKSEKVVEHEVSSFTSCLLKAA
jgi:Mycobacterium membrane protein